MALAPRPSRYPNVARNRICCLAVVERGNAMTIVTPTQFEFLRSIDTPTVCNLLEIVAPERRGFGYTVRHLHCPFPDLPPMVGFAKTVTMRAQDRVPLGEAGYMNKRLDYLDYVAVGAAARHRGDPGPRRHRRLRRVLGRGADQHPQGAGLPRHHHQRLDPRHPAGRAGLPDAGRLDCAVARLRPCGGLRRQCEHPRHGGAKRRPDPRRPARRRGGAAQHHRRA